MIKFENTKTYGWDAAIRGMRNPMNSWGRSDSKFDVCYSEDEGQALEPCGVVIGENDLSLMARLAAAGPVHAKYRRMITVTVDITAPLYWWKEFDTYKVGTVANSCSTMHKIHSKEFNYQDFSYDKLLNTCGVVDYVFAGTTYGCGPLDVLGFVIQALNYYRDRYNETKDQKYWDWMIQLLPSSYNQKRTIQLNYEVLAGLYPDRRNHKLTEWRTLCEWIEQLPYSELITAKKKEVDT